ncbi:MAG TPA: polyprenyl synthetase family protein, partial [Bacteroidia bacterium]|nr:polyprenyl synthetase family protein [Bacteroidia bacterium]
QDDILDVYADPEKFGKQIGGDIIANKKTYLLLSALYHANIDQYEQLTDLLHDTKNRYAAYEKISRVTTIYNALGVKEMAAEAVKHYYQLAITHLEAVEMDAPQKQMLYDFGSDMLQREL